MVPLSSYHCSSSIRIIAILILILLLIIDSTSMKVSKLGRVAKQKNRKSFSISSKQATKRVANNKYSTQYTPFPSPSLASLASIASSASSSSSSSSVDSDNDSDDATPFSALFAEITRRYPEERAFAPPAMPLSASDSDTIHLLRRMILKRDIATIIKVLELAKYENHDPNLISIIFHAMDIISMKNIATYGMALKNIFAKSQFYKPIAEFALSLSSSRLCISDTSEDVFSTFDFMMIMTRTNTFEQSVKFVNQQLQRAPDPLPGQRGYTDGITDQHILGTLAFLDALAADLRLPLSCFDDSAKYSVLIQLIDALVDYKKLKKRGDRLIESQEYYVILKFVTSSAFVVRWSDIKADALVDKLVSPDSKGGDLYDFIATYRDEYASDEQRGKTVLCVGDGDLSFSASLRRSLEARADTGAASYLVYGTSLETREDLYRRYRNASANAVFLQGSAEQPAAATTAIGSGAHRTYSSLAWAADPEAAAAAAAAAATATAAATAERPPQGRVRGEAVFAVDAGDLFETFCKPSGTYRVDLIVFNFPYADCGDEQDSFDTQYLSRYRHMSMLSALFQSMSQLQRYNDLSLATEATGGVYPSLVLTLTSPQLALWQVAEMANNNNYYLADAIPFDATSAGRLGYRRKRSHNDATFPQSGGAWSLVFRSM